MLPQDQGLETLRQRATCVICYEFYNKPKRLSCSHSLCLSCLQRHFQLNCHKNFPPCPMCRKPITVSQTKLETLEPDIAVQDIVEFVKRYELCGLCKQKTNPSLKCDECSAFVCDNCVLCHETLKPSHMTVSILPSSASRITPSKHTCKEHPDQPLNLFCIVCHRVLCIHCKEYNHESCVINKDKENELYRRGFLNVFIQSSDDLKLKLENSTMSRVVYIPVFAREARKWLQAVQVEVLACNNFFEDLREKLVEIENNPTRSTCTFRSHVKSPEIGNILVFGKVCEKKINKLLSNETSETDVAIAIEDTEKACLTVFRYRRAFPVHTEPFTRVERNYGSKKNSEQISKCSIKLCTLLKSLFIFNMTYNAAEFDQSIDKSETTRNKQRVGKGSEGVPAVDISSFSALSIVFLEDILHTGVIINRYMYRFILDILYKQMFIELAALDIDFKYANEFLEQSELRKEDTLKIRMVNVDIGYSELLCTCSWEFEVSHTGPEKPQILIFNKNLGVGLITQFVNVAVLPCQSIDGTDNRIQGEHTDRITPYLFLFIGNRERGAGLESVFLYIDSDKCIKYGLSICATVAKFKSSAPVYLNAPKQKIHLNHTGVTIIKNRNDTFDVNIRQEADSYRLAYTSKSTFDSVPENFIGVIDGMGSGDVFEANRRIIYSCITLSMPCMASPNIYSKPLTMSFFKVTLLCNFANSICFVRRNDMGELEIGQFMFSSTSVTEKLMCTVESSETDIPLEKLRPRTMVQRRNEAIVVACSVEGDTENLVMILTDKRGAEAVEVLKIDYAASKLEVVNAGNADSDENKEKRPETKIGSVVPRAPSVLEETVTAANAMLGETPTTGASFISEQNSIAADVAVLAEAGTEQEDVRPGGETSFTDMDSNNTGGSYQMTNRMKKLSAETSTEINGPVTENTLKQISEATVTDLEMDEEGNIMILLDKRDCGSYCVCTKYFFP